MQNHGISIADALEILQSCAYIIQQDVCFYNSLRPSDVYMRQ